MSGLREALNEILWDVFQGYATPQDGLTQIDALLPEHRDEVRALIGDEQVPEGMTAEKLRTLADWFDTYDAMAEQFIAVMANTAQEDVSEALATVRGTEVQDDLRRWANALAPREES